MMKIALFFSVFFYSLIFSQEQPVQTTQLNELMMVGKNGKVIIDAEKPAYYPLGLAVFKNTIVKNFRSRKISSNLEKEFCEITFVIERDGTMTEIKASGTNESFNTEALRAVSKTTQKWVPAEIDGEKVRYRFRIPLTISINKK